MTKVPTPQEILAKLSPLPLAEGKVTAYKKGWTKAYYYDPVTNLQVKFKKPPTVVATAEARSGSPPAITAPTIKIPGIDLPQAPTITIPGIDLPSLPDVTIPTVTIPIDNLNALKGYRFSCGFAVAGICDGLNKLMILWDQALNTLMDLIGNVNKGFANAAQNLRDVITAISNFRGNTQSALNAYRDNIQTSINAALADARNKTQAALNAYRDSIQTSINQGLSIVIPALYDQIGVPLSELITPVQIRNVQADSFEFYALSAQMTIHYVAIGPKA